MTTQQQPAEVTITVSAPYTLIGGGWTGMRPQGQRRDYTASVLGHDIKNTSKDDIKRTIRALYYRETGSNRVRFTFKDGAVEDADRYDRSTESANPQHTW